MDDEIQRIYTKIDDLKKQVDHVKRELQDDRDKNNRRRQSIISRVDKKVGMLQEGFNRDQQHNHTRRKEIIDLINFLKDDIRVYNKILRFIFSINAAIVAYWLIHSIQYIVAWVLWT